MRLHFAGRLAALATVFALVLPATALADVVSNDVISTATGRVLTVEAGASAEISYTVRNTNQRNSTYPDDQNSCNPSSSTPLTITLIGLPAGVTGGSVQVDDCDEYFAATLAVPSTIAPGSYPVTHSFSDLGGGTYYGEADFTLEVLAPQLVTPLPANTAPSLSLPGDLVVEGNTTAGANVTYSATASDTEDGPLTPTCTPASGDFFTLGGPHSVDCAVTDGGGLTDQGSFAVTVVDTTQPSLQNVPDDVRATATGSNGRAVAYTAPTATDIVDAEPSVSCDHPSGSVFALGATTVTCTATDSSGNSATHRFTVAVSYAWSGVLQPINSDGGSVFKLGSTIPVKFRLTGDSAGIQTAVAKLYVTQLGTSVTGDEAEATSTAAATTGNLFRYDADSDQYVFNLGTKALSQGSWRLRIDLGDGASRAVDISLRK